VQDVNFFEISCDKNFGLTYNQTMFTSLNVVFEKLQELDNYDQTDLSREQEWLRAEAEEMWTVKNYIEFYLVLALSFFANLYAFREIWRTWF